MIEIIWLFTVFKKTTLLRLLLFLYSQSDSSCGNIQLWAGQNCPHAACSEWWWTALKYAARGVFRPVVHETRAQEVSSSRFFSNWFKYMIPVYLANVHQVDPLLLLCVCFNTQYVVRSERVLCIFQAFELLLNQSGCSASLWRFVFSRWFCPFVC